jgi:thiamine-phosphate pyrophosphorylase
MTSLSTQKLWQHATQWHRRSAPRGKNRVPPLLFMTDQQRIPDPVAVIESLPSGAGVVLRDYDLAERRALAADLSAVCGKNGIILLIGADAELAQRVGAAGVHLPEYMVHRAPALRRQYPRFLWTGAAHSYTALVRAERTMLDAALLSPIFATASHPGSAFLGTPRAAQMVQRSDMPILALGGIDASNVGRLNGAGFSGLAAIGALAEQAG